MVRMRSAAVALIAGSLIALAVLGGASAAQAAAPDDTWSANPAAPDTGAWRSVAWSPSVGVFVAVGSAGAVMTSPDGVTWAAQTAPVAQWTAVTWSPELNLFAAVASNGTTRVMTSPDGVTWTTHTTTTSSAWQTIVWSPDRHEFLVNATAAAELTSNDGVTWTSSSGGSIPNLVQAEVWSPSLGRYVAVTNNGSVASSDGVTWTAGASLPAAGWRGIAWSPALGRFVAVGAGVTAFLMTSTDGITWTAPSTPVTSALGAVTWSPEQAEFVAVGPGQILGSPDGITWTAITDPAPTNTWRSLVWSASQTRYVGIADGGTNRTLVGIIPTVTPPATGGTTADAPPRPTLAESGVDAAPWGTAAVLCIAVGIIAVSVRRRSA